MVCQGSIKLLPVDDLSGKLDYWIRLWGSVFSGEIEPSNIRATKLDGSALPNTFPLSTLSYDLSI